MSSPYLFDATTDTFDRYVLENSFHKPVLVDFWADWCAPCKALFPVLEKIVDSYEGELLLAKVNCDVEVGLTERFGIRSLPTVVLFKDGQPVEGFAGVQPEGAIRDLLAPHVNEPTAAACYYASLPAVKKITGKVLVFDLGGGTFDVTVCEIEAQKVEVITSRGDKWLGGKDFDSELVNIMNNKYKEATGEGLDLANKKLEYMEKAEQIKRALSVREKNAEVIEGPKGPKKIEITRSEFEQSIQTHIEKLKMLMEEALDGSGLKPENISHTLLVGGSTRIPIVTKTIENIMKKPPLKGVNVDEAVAAGAAIYAGLKSKRSLNEAQKQALEKVKMQDVCNFYLGTLVQADDPVLNRKVTTNMILIDRDTPLPATKTDTIVTIYDDQEAVSLEITQSEGREKNREFVNIIHEGRLEFPDKKPKGRPIQVTYKYDTSGKLHCTFMDESSKKKYEVSLRPESAEDLKKQYESIEHIVIE